jgi:LuxR family maltose regulon positive regulatory protein
VGRTPPVRGAAAGAAVAWLALDGDDNEPSVFWSGVIAAVRASGAVAADNPLDQLAIEQGMTAQGMRTLRHGLADLPPGVVLVLDDFQVINHPEILESVAVLLRHESPLRLVLITRSDPVLPLHRLRVSGGLCEIRSADLAFEHLADEFFGSMGMPSRPLISIGSSSAPRVGPPACG